MITVTSNGTMGIRLTGAERPIAVFDPKLAQSGDLFLLPVPEENPTAGTISWPGEYDYSGIMVRGIGQEEGQQVSFLVVADGMRFAFLAAPLKDWTDDQRSLLGEVDVVMIPSDDAKRMQTLLDDIDPRVLLLVPDAKGKIDPEVLKTCGGVGKEHVREHKLKGLPAEGREVVVMA